MVAVSERLALLITADGGGAIRELDKVGKSARSNLGEVEAGSKKVATSMLAMGAGAAAGGVVVLRSLDQLAQGAQGTADSVDKALSVFGRASGVEEWAGKQADALGLSKEAALDAAAGYGVLLRGVGVAGTELVKQSEALAGITVDIAERFKLDPNAVREKIAAALKGGKGAAKGLLDFGIDITDVNVSDEAVRSGIAKLGEKLTREQKALAATQIILRSDAKGEFARSLEGGDVGAQAQVAAANWKNASDEIGRSVIPVMTKVAKVFGDVASIAQRLPFSDQIGGVVAYGAALTVAVGGLSAVYGAMSKVSSVGKALFSGLSDASAASSAAALAAAQSQVAISAEAAAAAEANLTRAVSTFGVGSAEATAASSALSGAMTRQAVAAEELAVAQSAGVSSTGGMVGMVGKLAGALGVAAAAYVAVDQAMQMWEDNKKKQILGSMPTTEETAASAASRAVAARTAGASLGTGISNFKGREGVGASKETVRGIASDYLLEVVKAAKDADEAVALVQQIREAAVRTGGLSAQQLATYMEPFEAQLVAIRIRSAETSNATQAAGDDTEKMGESAARAVSPMQALADAMAGVNREGEAGKTATFAQNLDSAVDAIDGLAEANDRLKSAQERVANAAKVDAKNVSDAYGRLIDAKRALDDALDDGAKLGSSASELADARRALADANARLSINPDDAKALTAKDIAISDMEAASKRLTEENRAAKDRHRSIEQATRGVNDAQKAYDEALANRGKEAQAAHRDLMDAERNLITAQQRLGDMVRNTEGGLAGMVRTIDDLVSRGIIPADVGEDLKSTMSKFGDAAVTAAAKLDALTKAAEAARPAFKPDPNKPVGYGAMAPGAPGPTRLFPGGPIPSAPIKTGSERKDKPRYSAAEGFKAGLPSSLSATPAPGTEAVSDDGTNYRFDGKRWIPHYATGGVVPGSGYGDTVPAMLTPGEFVVRKEAVSAIGVDRLHELNALKFATGGEVSRPTSFARTASTGPREQPRQADVVTFSPTIIQQVRDDRVAGRAVVTALRGVAHRAGRGIRVPA